MIERVIAATTRGRYLIEAPASRRPAPLLVGFHGYGEGAGTQLERMRRIPGADRWLLASIEGLHRFYQRRSHQQHYLLKVREPDYEGYRPGSRQLRAGMGC